MADKSSQLIIDALTRAASMPPGTPLFGQKSEPGLFPATALARSAAERAIAEGLLSVSAASPQGKSRRDAGMLTSKGCHFLAQQVNPRQLLEDFVRTVEQRQHDLSTLSNKVADLAAGLAAMRSVVERMLPRLADFHANGTHSNGTMALAREKLDTVSEQTRTDVKSVLAEWQVSAGAAHDCPLPDLYRRLKTTTSIGLFHDTLRQLHDENQIYLHPWTGPLYTLPEPALALMIGHEVAYYASIR